MYMYMQSESERERDGKKERKKEIKKERKKKQDGAVEVEIGNESNHFGLVHIMISRVIMSYIIISSKNLVSCIQSLNRVKISLRGMTGCLTPAILKCSKKSCPHTSKNENIQTHTNLVV